MLSYNCTHQFRWEYKIFFNYYYTYYLDAGDNEISKFCLLTKYYRKNLIIFHEMFITFHNDLLLLFVLKTNFASSWKRFLPSEVRALLNSSMQLLNCLKYLRKSHLNSFYRSSAISKTNVFSISSNFFLYTSQAVYRYQIQSRHLRECIY